MLILPFLLAGVFMLSVLNPRFTVTLLQHTLSQAGLLLIDAPRRRAASQYLLAQLPWTSTDGPRAPSYNPPTLPPAFSVSSFEPPLHRTCLFHIASSIWAATPPTFRGAISTVTSVYWPRAAQILVFFLLIFFLRRISIGLVRSFRVVRLSSPALEFVEDLRKQVYGQAFTPGSSQGSYASCGRDDENGPSDSCDIVGSSLVVGLGGISGPPLALRSPMREVNNGAESPNLQPAKEPPMEALPPSQTTRMDVLGWGSESMHAFIEEEFTDRLSDGREDLTVSRQARNPTSFQLLDDLATPMQCHDVILQPAPDTVDRPRRFRSTKGWSPSLRKLLVGSNGQHRVID